MKTIQFIPSIFLFASMKQVLLLLFIFLSLRSYSQENLMLSPDSLMKVNKVKKVTMRSKNKSGTGTSIYYYNKSGELEKHETLFPYSSDVALATDYYFDSTGKKYASLMHGEPISTWKFTPGYPDSLLFEYYEYNSNRKIKRAYRMYASGKIMYEVIYAYEPKTTTRRSYNELGNLTGEDVSFYEKEQFIIKSVSKKYDSMGKLISTFTHDYTNTYNPEGQLTEVSYRNDSCSCVGKNEYYANGLIKKRTNVGCKWTKKFTYKYYK
ncbi:MAG: hypothetical protein QM737_19895 [Ferruginibacter sp.]